MLLRKTSLYSLVMGGYTDFIGFYNNFVTFDHSGSIFAGEARASLWSHVVTRRKRGELMLPKQFDALLDEDVWMCHPLIWNEKKHGGVGGYDKPPINPFTLRNGSSTDPQQHSIYVYADAQIGKAAQVVTKAGLVSCKVAGVCIVMSPDYLLGIDLDNVARKDESTGKIRVTSEAREIIKAMNTYTELSPSGTGVHIYFRGSLPANLGTKVTRKLKDAFGTDKAEYQLFDSGILTITGKKLLDVEIAERTEAFAEVYRKYFLRESAPAATDPAEDERRAQEFRNENRSGEAMVAPIDKPSSARPASAPSVVSCGFTRERWLEDVRRLSDAEILDGIFASGRTGYAVQRLYNGDTSDYNGDHSVADLALCTFLYGFTDDRDLTERLFRSSRLYRATGKSRNYLNRTLDKASQNCKPLVGHITLTPEDKRNYAKQREAEERAARSGYFDKYKSQSKPKPASSSNYFDKFK